MKRSRLRPSSAFRSVLVLLLSYIHTSLSQHLVLELVPVSLSQHLVPLLVPVSVPPLELVLELALVLALDHDLGPNPLDEQLVQSSAKRQHHLFSPRDVQTERALER